jgi:hypothetical protein
MFPFIIEYHSIFTISALIKLFSILPKFWKNVYYLCQNFNKIKISTLKFELQTFENNDFKLNQFRHIRLFHNSNNNFYFIL